MAKLKWREVGTQYYETGVKDVVLFVYDENNHATGSDYKAGVAWKGITSISETPSGGEASDLYADDDKYISLYSEEQLGASVEAYTYPDEWAECDGSAVVGDGLELKQQSRSLF